MISREALTDELIEAVTPNQHLARPVLWIRIRIRMDPHHLVTWICTQTRIPSKKNPDPDRYQSDKLDPEPDPDPHQFADDKPKCTYGI
jgi:hypothetical protein